MLKCIFCLLFFLYFMILTTKGELALKSGNIVFVDHSLFLVTTCKQYVYKEGYCKEK